jgi:hypothetical protein
MTTTLQLQKRNHRLEDINFVEGTALVVFKMGEDTICKFTMVDDNQIYIVTEAKNKLEQIAKFMAKYMEVPMSISEVDVQLNILQKRMKMYLDFGKDETSTTTEDQDQLPELTPAPKKAVVEAPKAEPVVIPEPVRKEMYVAPKPALGLEAVIANMVTDGINDHSTTTLINEKVQKFLTDNGIVPNRTEIMVNLNGQEVRNVGTQHFRFKTILQAISARVNVALVGPAGSGKTTAVKKVAEALNLKYYSKSVSAQTGSHEFFGYQDANGNYVRTLFREAYEFGGIFLLDEFDAGNPNVLAALNQATANGECAFADGMITRHQDFVIIMAGNTFGHGATSEYVGRNKIDAATLDRFAFIQFGYDEKMEMEIAGNKEWCKKVQAIRKKVAEKRIKTVVSPRATIDGSKLLAIGMDEAEVMELLIYKGLSQDERSLLS